MLEAEFLSSIGEDVWQQEQYAQFMAAKSDPWLTLWRSWGAIGKGASGSTYSCLLPIKMAEKALKDPGWDIRIDSNNPGFSQSYSEGGTRTTYEPIGSDGVQPIVHVRLQAGRFSRDVIVLEELILLFDLHRGADGNWFWIDEAGDDQLVLTVEPDLVRARRWLIRRYQAARQLALELTIDSDLWDDSLRSLGSARGELRTDISCLNYHREDIMPGDRWFSRLLGKHILPPPPIDECGLWPYLPQPQYESFAIGVDDVGRPVEYSANPDGLANYFGANPDAPQYVTPVVFQREVLEKYYRSPDKYSIEDGYLRRDGYWGVRIDNDDPEVVVMLLGDLGRDLPYSEQNYWKSFNIPAKGTFSETAVRRGFLAEFVDAASLDLQFRRLYPELKEAWQRRFGWTLFREPASADAHLLQQVRLLAQDQQPSFDEHVLILAKLVVDALNEGDLERAVGPGPHDEKGLQKLERFLDASGLPGRDSIMDTLRNLQNIRSAGAAHWKGKRYERLRAGASSNDRRQWFADILERVVTALEDLRAFAAKPPRS